MFSNGVQTTLLFLRTISNTLRFDKKNSISKIFIDRKKMSNLRIFFLILQLRIQTNEILKKKYTKRLSIFFFK